MDRSSETLAVCVRSGFLSSDSAEKNSTQIPTSRSRITFQSACLCTVSRCFGWRPTTTCFPSGPCQSFSASRASYSYAILLSTRVKNADGACSSRSGKASSFPSSSRRVCSSQVGDPPVPDCMRAQISFRLDRFETELLSLAIQGEHLRSTVCTPPLTSSAQTPSSASKCHSSQ